MSDPTWRKIRFTEWKSRGLEVSTNEYADGDGGDGPVVLEIRDNDYPVEGRQSHWMMPDEARKLAAKLVEAAAACDRAGVRVSPKDAPDGQET